jgi:hypothetical protein
VSDLISEEQFRFMFKRQIHDVVALAQEDLHSLKTKKVLSFVVKIDLSKAYDKVNWTFMRLTLIQMGMNIDILNWIMGCIGSASFIILINGSMSYFFMPSKDAPRLLSYFLSLWRFLANLLRMKRGLFF